MCRVRDDGENDRGAAHQCRRHPPRWLRARQRPPFPDSGRRMKHIGALRPRTRPIRTWTRRSRHNRAPGCRWQAARALGRQRHAGCPDTDKSWQRQLARSRRECECGRVAESWLQLRTRTSSSALRDRGGVVSGRWRTKRYRRWRTTCLFYRGDAASPQAGR